VGRKGIAAKRELGDDTEVASAPTETPEELGLLDLARRGPPAIRQHDAGLDEVVARQAEAAREPPDTSAQRKSPDAGVGDETCRCRQSMSLAALVQVTEQSTATDTNDVPLRIDHDGVEGAEVDDEPVVTHAVAGNAMSTTPDSQAQLALLSERDGRRHITVRGTLHDHSRPAIDPGIPYAACLVVVRVLAGDDPASETGSQLI
jgi:hypothetical protein